MTDREPSRVLIVDDKPENLRLLVQILHTQNYIVNPASSGPAALRFLKLSPDLPDIILLDIDMPGMSGYQLCSRLKENEAIRDIPVIFVSIGAQMADKAEAFARGGVDYITKPFQEEEVLMRVKTHLSLRDKQKLLEQRVHRQMLETAEIKEELEKERDMRRDVELHTASLGTVASDAGKTGVTGESRRLSGDLIDGAANSLATNIEAFNAGIFSEREKQILTLLASGIGNRELAERVFLSEATVKWHLRSIYQKLGVNNRSKAIFEAQKRALI
jgi:DNA-binding NarL/FixJ family response regulator